MVKVAAAVVMSVLLLVSMVPAVTARAVDLCPNLKGMQKEVPYGYEREIGLTGWECYPIGTR